MNSVQFVICCDKSVALQARPDRREDHRLQLRALRQRGGGGAAAGGERHRADRGAAELSMSRMCFESQHSSDVSHLSNRDSILPIALHTSCIRVVRIEVRPEDHQAACLFKTVRCPMSNSAE